jgi:hypothetical protein
LANIKKNEEKATSKKKSITFRAIKEDSDSTTSESEDEEMEMLTRKFHKFLKKQGKQVNKISSNIICYECKKKGHLRNDCPLNKEDNSKETKELKKKKKKAFKATWDDSDSDMDTNSSKSDDNEIAHLCLVATTEDTDNEVNLDFSFEELLEAYEELYHKARSFKKENKVLKNNYQTLELEKSCLEIELEMSKETNNQLHAKILELEDIYEHFEGTLNNLKITTRLNTEFCDSLKSKFQNERNIQNKSYAPRHA